MPFGAQFYGFSSYTLVALQRCAMSKKLSLSTLAALPGLLTKIISGAEISSTGQLSIPTLSTSDTTILTPNLDSTLDFNRIANALERIAEVLEKQKPLSSTDNSWISLLNAPLAIPRNLSIPKYNKDDISLNVQAKPAQDISIPQRNLSEPMAETTIILPSNQTILYKYLSERGISLVEAKLLTPDKQIMQTKLDALASYLGKNFTECQDLYNLLKKNMVAPRKSFAYNLKGATSIKNGIIQEFCRLLKEADLLEYYTYQPKPDYNFELKASGKEQKYLNGSWLENCVKLEIADLFAQSKQLYEALPNLQIVFQDNSKTELDLLFCLGKQIFCIETKMRPSSAQLKKYLNTIKPLKLDSKAVLVVVVDKSEEECQKLSKESAGVKVIRLENLASTLLSLVK